MEIKKYENAMRFYLLATKLKYKLRSAWDKNHWGINSERLESIAEHVYGTCILAISLDSEFEFGVNLDKVLKMLVIHEIGEVVIGDITPFDNITREEKMEMEHNAIIHVVGDLIKKDELISLLFEFDDRKTKEAKFAYYCDKLEADIQSKVYQDMGCHITLDRRPDTCSYNNDSVEKIIENGAKTVFDIWYEFDKSLYEENSIFSNTLDYIKNNNTLIKDDD